MLLSVVSARCGWYIAMQLVLGSREAGLQFRERHVQTSTHSQALRGWTTSGKLLVVAVFLQVAHASVSLCDLLAITEYNCCTSIHISECITHSIRYIPESEP